MDNPLFLIPFLAGVIIIIVSAILLKFPPKKINRLYGYRSSASMRSQERWDFAQIYSGKLMVKWGFILVLFSFAGSFIELQRTLSLILALLVMTGCVFIPILLTEKELRRKFGDE